MGRPKKKVSDEIKVDLGEVEENAQEEKPKIIIPEVEKIEVKPHFIYDEPSEPKKGDSIWGELGKDRYKFFGKYKIDRWIFQIFLSVMLISFFWVVRSNDFELDYYACIDPPTELPLWNPNLDYEIKVGMCHNPFYKPANWKNVEYLTPGEYGIAPGKIIKPLIWSVILGLLATIGINHLVHNRGWKRG